MPYILSIVYNLLLCRVCMGVTGHNKMTEYWGPYYSSNDLGLGTPRISESAVSTSRDLLVVLLEPRIGYLLHIRLTRRLNCNHPGAGTSSGAVPKD